MNFKTIHPNNSISHFVKSILVFEEQEENQNTVLPFFADGYPGLIFQEAANGLVVSPHNKKMPFLFLYGQTIKPIELHFKGSYKLIIFQLYPCVLKSFFDITSKDINDSCYDLTQVSNGLETEQKLIQNKSFEKRIEIINDFLFAIFQIKKEKLDFKIKQAIQLILDHKGKIAILQICNNLSITERTFERRFLKEVGILPKQFSQIIQFQQSLEQLTLKDYTKLTDIVYANGFSDQSHFIKVFKAFTGKTPKNFTPKK
jgi:AraC-like DNA-binding protein